MEAMVTRSVNEIPDSARKELEGLLGRHLEANQQVFLMVLSPTQKPDAELRRKAGESIRQRLAEIDRHAAAQGVTADEADAAVEEAMEHIRPRP